MVAVIRTIRARWYRRHAPKLLSQRRPYRPMYRVVLSVDDKVVEWYVTDPTLAVRFEKNVRLKPRGSK